MRAALLLLPLLLLALATPVAARSIPAASPLPRPGDVLVSVSFKTESEAAWNALVALGYRNVSEQRVMVALPGGKRGCVAFHRGWLPTHALAAARKLASVQPVPDEQR